MDNTSYKSLMKSQRTWQEYKNQEFSFIQKISIDLVILGLLFYKNLEYL